MQGQQPMEELNLVKLDALKKGKHTDCVFLVGPDDGVKEEVHAVKSIMMMTSSFMEELFNSLHEPGPIRIVNVEPKIFKHIVCYVHLGVLEWPVSCEELLKILIRADQLLIGSLKVECVKWLERELDASTVWPTLQTILGIESLMSSANCCIPALRNHTRASLNHPTFLSCNADCVRFLLQQTDLSLESEGELVSLCVTWAQHQENPRNSFRKVFGHLRLLTLAPKELLNLPMGFLTQLEYETILRVSLRCGGQQDLLEAPGTLCHLLESRKWSRGKKRKRIDDVYSIILVPESMLTKCSLDLEDNEIYTAPCDCTLINCVSLTPKCDMHLTQVCLLEQVRGSYPGLKYNHELQKHERVPNKDKFLLRVLKDEDIHYIGLVKPADDDYTLINLDDTILLPKGQATKLKFELLVEPSNKEFSLMQKTSSFRNIQCVDVQTTDPQVCKNIHFDVPVLNQPVFVKELHFVVST